MKKIIFGSLLIFLSFFMFMGYLNADIDSGIFVEIITFSLVIVLPFFGGGYLIYSHYKANEDIKASKNALRMNTLEAEVLKLAEEKDGKLTVVEVMASLAVTDETAKACLDSLVVKSIADIEVSESGVIVYAFYDIAHLDEKRTAKGVLDV